MQEPAPTTVRLFDINSTQDVRLVALLGDSWTSKDRFKPEIVDTLPRDYIDIRPHATSSATGNDSLSNKIVVAEGAFLENYSEGGYTLNKFLNNTGKLNKWARELPELSILHVGACDIANNGNYEQKTIKRQFINDLAHFLREWPVRARKTLKNDHRLEAQFDNRRENHKWMIVKIPVWDESDGIRHISKKEFGELRKIANTALKTVRT